MGIKEKETLELIEKFEKIWFKSGLVIRYSNDILPRWDVFLAHYYKSGLIEPHKYTESSMSLYDALKTIDSRLRAEKYDGTDRLL